MSIAPSCNDDRLPETVGDCHAPDCFRRAATRLLPLYNRPGKRMVGEAREPDRARTLPKTQRP